MATSGNQISLGYLSCYLPCLINISVCNHTWSILNTRFGLVFTPDLFHTYIMFHNWLIFKCSLLVSNNVWRNFLYSNTAGKLLICDRYSYLFFRENLVRNMYNKPSNFYFAFTLVLKQHCYLYSSIKKSFITSHVWTETDVICGNLYWGIW